VTATSGGRGAVFLLTDYGYEDEFAGLTRAVILKLAPAAPVVDLTHGVPPFDVRAGALTLSRTVGHLGPGVVVAVVDPGVGSGRRAVAVAVGAAGNGPPGAPAGGPRYLVGPDNGLLGWAVEALGGPRAAVALTPVAHDGVGASFDGRDLFGPVAARLWSGAGLHDVGLPVDPGRLVRLPDPLLRVSAGAVEAEVLWVDRFGNAALAAAAADAGTAGIEGPVAIGVGTATTKGRRVGSFAELGGDELGLMVDANGQLALVCDRRSAATVLGVEAGDRVTLRPDPGPAR
jgi:S-adenosyl-L-methionine hydrolase (adenosine-forming)